MSLSPPWIEYCSVDQGRDPCSDIGFDAGDAVDLFNPCSANLKVAGQSVTHLAPEKAEGSTSNWIK